MTKFTAFAGDRLIARGALLEVALAVRAHGAEATLVFEDSTGRVVDLDLRGSAADVVERLAALHPPLAAEPAKQRGRPKLGVVPREVTLLPRHWDWLATQSGGASAAIRRLVDEARRGDSGQTERRAAQERAYRFLSAIAGDLPGFEEASRALFADDRTGFAARIESWPGDIAGYALRLGWD